MSSWGNLDNVAITGNITCTAGSTVIANAAANATVFLNDVKPGDYLIIANQKYQVYSVNSNVLMTLTDAVTNTANVAFIQQGPKYISNVALSANTYTIQRVIGVDKNEANVASNNLKNIKTPGWNHYFTYTDALGQTRHKNEALVAMSKNFNSNATLVLQTDATDDATVADRAIFFTIQPANASNVAGANVVLTSNAATLPEGGALTYTWYESTNGTAYTKVNDGDDYSGNTTNVLTIVNVSNTDGSFFFVTATTTDGGTSSANSDIVTTTVTA